MTLLLKIVAMIFYSLSIKKRKKDMKKNVLEDTGKFYVSYFLFLFYIIFIYFNSSMRKKKSPFLFSLFKNLIDYFK